MRLTQTMQRTSKNAKKNAKHAINPNRAKIR